MFSSESKDQRKNNHKNGSQQSIIAGGTKIKGDIICESPLRIDGTLDGTINTTQKVVVGKSGAIKGGLKGVDATFEGKFSGQLELSGTLSLKSTADIEGELYIQKLSVEPGATFNATCSMSSNNVKSLNNKKLKRSSS